MERSVRDTLTTYLAEFEYHHRTLARRFAELEVWLEEKEFDGVSKANGSKEEPAEFPQRRSCEDEEFSS